MAGKKITAKEAHEHAMDVLRRAEEGRKSDAERDYRESVATCTWMYDDEYDTWDTECGWSFCQLEGTLRDNGHKYCPACGGLITETNRLDT